MDFLRRALRAGFADVRGRRCGPGMNLPPSRILQLAAVALFLITAYFFLQPRNPKPQWKSPIAKNPQEELALENDVFKQLNLPAKFEYRRHCIVTTQDKGLRRESMVDLPQTLLTEPIQVEIGKETPPEALPESSLPPCEKTIQLNVPEWDSYAHVNASSLVLGAATTMARIDEALDHMTRWLSNTSAHLVVLLVDQPKLHDVRAELERIQAKAASLHIDLTFEPYKGSFKGDSEGVKNFALAPALEKNRRPDTKWFGVIDDDTFFLSLPRTLEQLNTYNGSDMWYVGALTEGYTRVKNEGLKAWGGAGFFLSSPLLELLAESHKPCLKLDKYYGDLLWRDCILEVTSPTLRLTEMKGLNQIDLWGDLAGWYEGPHNPLYSIHHWHSWHSFPVPNSHLIADAAGPESFLQRYKMFNNTVLTNGFSIVKYPKGLPDLNKVEQTFTEDVGKKTAPGRLEFHHSIGQTRRPLEKGVEKISWQFRRAIKATDGTVRQFYIRGMGQDADSVIELDWQRSA